MLSLENHQVLTQTNWNILILSQKNEKINTCVGTPSFACLIITVIIIIIIWPWVGGVGNFLRSDSHSYSEFTSVIV